MFGHLKPEEFMDAMDGVSLPAAGRSHLNACPTCAAQLRSIEAIGAGLAMEDNITEPDWADFRGAVRLELLSRSIKRDSTVRRWTGWPVRSAVAWGLSFVLMICLGTGAFVWHAQKDANMASQNATARSARTVETHTITLTVPVADRDADTAAWNNDGVFEDLSNLDEHQAERLRELVRSAQKGNSD